MFVHNAWRRRLHRSRPRRDHDLSISCVNRIEDERRQDDGVHDDISRQVWRHLPVLLYFY